MNADSPSDKLICVYGDAPVGRLTYDGSQYIFAYYDNTPVSLPGMDELWKVYISSELFPFIRGRITESEDTDSHIRVLAIVNEWDDYSEWENLVLGTGSSPQDELRFLRADKIKRQSTN